MAWGVDNMKPHRKARKKKGVPVASSVGRNIPLQGMLGYFQRAVMVPVHAVEEKPKTSAAVLCSIIIVALAIHGLMVTPFQASNIPPPPPTAQLTFYSTNNTGYLEFLDLANQSGDIVLTNGQSITLNATQSYIILFVPYDSDTVFEQWAVAGDATLAPGTYMTNMTLTSNTTIVAIAVNPNFPIPEFPSSSLVVSLGIAAIIPQLFRRKATAHQNDSSPHT
jgi:hypothetical protein